MKVRKFSEKIISILITAILVPSTSACGQEVLTKSVNRTYLREIFTNIFGYTPDCLQNVTHASDTTLLSRCPRCACTQDCRGRGDCCTSSCRSTYVLQTNTQFIESPPGVYMIDTCPDQANASLIKYCHENVSKFNFLDLVPVSSVSSGITYKNRFCADCNHIMDYVRWRLAVDCSFNMNLMSSSEEIWEYADQRRCSIKYDIDSPKINQCYPKDVLINRCNVSGVWKTGTVDIDWACNNTEQHFDVFRNVYCYLCNTDVTPLKISDLRTNASRSKMIENSINTTVWPVKGKTTYSEIILDDALITKTGHLDFLAKKKYFTYSINITLWDLCHTLESFNRTTADLLRKYSLCLVENKQVLKRKNVSSDLFPSVQRAFKSGRGENFYQRQLSRNASDILRDIFPSKRSCDDSNNPCDCEVNCLVNPKQSNCCYDVMFQTPLSCVGDSRKEASEVMITACPNSDHLGMKQLCENSPTEYAAYDIPVRHIDISFPFKNIFCFACYVQHFRKQNISLSNQLLLPLGIQFRCKSSIDPFQIMTLKGFISEGLSKCTMQYVNPFSSDISCTRQKQLGSKEGKTASCNVTGKWLSYDKDIKLLCAMDLPSSYNPVCLPTYKNVFCEICNGVDIFGCSLLVVYRMPVYRRVFSVHDFLKKKEEGQNTKHGYHENCPVDQIWDSYERKCRQLKCIPGRRLVNGKCVPLFTPSYDLRYTLAIEAVLLNVTGKPKVNVLGVWAKIQEYIIAFAREDNMTVIDGYVTYIHTSAEDIDTSHVGKSFKLLVFLRTEVNVPVDRELLERDLMKMTNLTLDLNYRHTFLVYTLKESVDAFKLPMTYETLNPLKVFKQRLGSYRRRSLVSNDDSFSFLVSKLLYCPQVAVGDSLVLSNISVFIKIKQNEKLLSPFEYFKLGNTVQICREDFNSENASESSTMEKALFIFSLICTVVSLVCIILTFTALCFLSKRCDQTLPGKLLLSLMTALFLSQLMGLIALNDVPHALCLILGILSHYFWLATFACSFVCSFHMYRVFTDVRPVFNQAKRERRLFRIYVISSFTSPMVFVAGYFAYSFCCQSYAFNLYERDECFISNFAGLIAFFIVPIAVVAVVNFYFFFRTTYAIKSTPKTEGLLSNTKHSRIFQKLFVITCTMWLFQIVDGLFPISLFSFLVTFMNGSQGTFIFISYIFERKKLVFIKSKLPKIHHRKENTNTSSEMM